MEMKNCRNFNGYKPCGKSGDCSALCEEFQPIKTRVLVVGLGAMGAVLRATAILPPLIRSLPGAQVTWITEASTLPLLQNNPLIDRILGLNFQDLLKIEGQIFDFVFVMDKDLRIGGILNRVQARKILGFRVNPQWGVIEPAGIEARELYELGLSDHKKFFVNTKSEIQLITEAFGLEWKKDEYVLQLTPAETSESQKRRKMWLNGQSHLIGLNTGCSAILPYKKLTVEGHRRLIEELQKSLPNAGIVLLGGPEDQNRNEQIARGFDVIESATNQGLRDGLVSVDACDLVVTGDSLGMHMAIALKKWVVAWFGPTCAQEIELYGRGEKIITEAQCHPCWKRVCDKSPMCYDQVDLTTMVEAVERGLNCISPSSKQHFLETSF